MTLKAGLTQLYGGRFSLFDELRPLRPLRYSASVSVFSAASFSLGWFLANEEKRRISPQSFLAAPVTAKVTRLIDLFESVDKILHDDKTRRKTVRAHLRTILEGNGIVDDNLLGFGTRYHSNEGRMYLFSG